MRDGDATNPATVTVNLKDGGAAAGQVVSGLVSEDGLPGGSGPRGLRGLGRGTRALAQPRGVDRLRPRRLQAGTASVSATPALTAGGQAVNYATVGNVLYGYTGAAPAAGVVPALVVFTLALDPATGAFTFELLRPWTMGRRATPSRACSPSPSASRSRTGTGRRAPPRSAWTWRTASDGSDLVHRHVRGRTPRGRPGNDTLLGNEGDDTLIGGLGSDSVAGGEGRDRIVLQNDIRGARHGLAHPRPRRRGSLGLHRGSGGTADAVAGGAGRDTLVPGARRPAGLRGRLHRGTGPPLWRRGDRRLGGPRRHHAGGGLRRRRRPRADQRGRRRRRGGRLERRGVPRRRRRGRRPVRLGGNDTLAAATATTSSGAAQGTTRSSAARATTASTAGSARTRRRGRRRGPDVYHLAGTDAGEAFRLGQPAGGSAAEALVLAGDAVQAELAGIEEVAIRGGAEADSLAVVRRLPAVGVIGFDAAGATTPSTSSRGPRPAASSPTAAAASTR
jgi:hypothetical protein